MSFSSNNNQFNFLKFVTEQILTSLVKASGRKVSSTKDTVTNLQCVKLTKEHEPVIQMVSYWCALRLNRLQRANASPELIQSITQRDARFLTAVSHAIATQKDKVPAYDAWLFFDGDVKTTCFFELTQCVRNTKDVTSSLVIRMDR